MNPNFMQIALSMVAGRKNPMGMLQNASRQNPQLAQALQMLNGKTPQELQQIAEGLAKQRGVDLRQFAQSIGVPMQ